MAGPFPGMDPYLEGRLIWPDVHLGLIAAIRDVLVPQVAPAYSVRIEQRTYIAQVTPPRLVGRPDLGLIRAVPDAAPAGGTAVATLVAVAPQVVALPEYEEIREGYLELRDSGTQEVVTVIEILSPTNKQPGEGRREYEAKRQQVLRSQTSLVEIDLLRAGEPMAMVPQPRLDYRLLLGAGWERPQATLYAFGLRQAIPEIPIPLRRGEAPAALALGTVLSELYQRARYDLSLDYRERPPDPPLADGDAAWIDELLCAKGLR